MKATAPTIAEQLREWIKAQEPGTLITIAKAREWSEASTSVARKAVLSAENEGLTVELMNEGGVSNAKYWTRKND